jgi:hypothetical protein
MKWPWVSRELYEKAEAERKQYLDLLLAPLKPVVEVIPPLIGVEDAKEAVDQATGVISAAKLRQMAQDAANKRANLIAR